LKLLVWKDSTREAFKLPVAVNNKYPFSVHMRLREWISCAILTNFNVIRNAPSATKVLKFSCKLSDIFPDFKRIWSYMTDFNKHPNAKVYEIRSSGCGAGKLYADRKTNEGT
jgi:hypothetical protein